MNPTLKGLDQWPNTAPTIGALDASRSATQEDRIAMKEPSPELKQFMERLAAMPPEDSTQLSVKLIASIFDPKTDSLPPSSPATPSESPERVETADQGFKRHLEQCFGGRSEPMKFDVEDMKQAFYTGWSLGRTTK